MEEINVEKLFNGDSKEWGKLLQMQKFKTFYGSSYETEIEPFLTEFVSYNEKFKTSQSEKSLETRADLDKSRDLLKMLADVVLNKPPMSYASYTENKLDV